MTEPRIVSRSDHGISRKNIDEDVLRILYRLQAQGFKAFLVGGSVRDLMLGIKPKDFDVATDARPRRLKRLFRNCRIIGRRFRLAHLHFPGDKVVEVATFRSSGESDEVIREGELIRRDNVFGTPEEDARRRDLTINALFYNVEDFSVIDYIGGVDDLRAKTIRTIGDPWKSFREDPVRILRAIRHGKRLGFDVEENTLLALRSEKKELVKVNPARLLEEFYKDLSSGRARAFFEALDEHGILDVLVPDLVATLRKGGDEERTRFFEAITRLDRMTQDGVTVTHVIALCAFFAPLIVPVARKLCQPDAKEPHPPWAPFVRALVPTLRSLRIYRRDEERMWHVLGAWPKLALACGRGKIPVSLSRRTFFPEVVEVMEMLGAHVIDLPGEVIAESLAAARDLPPPSEEEIAAEERSQRRKRRRRRRAPREGDESTDDSMAGEEAAGDGDVEGDGSDAGEIAENGDASTGGAARTRPRRRRRKRRPRSERRASHPPAGGGE